MVSVNLPRFSLKQLWTYVRPQPLLPVCLRIVFACLFLLVESGASVATPWVFSDMVKQLSEQQVLTSAMIALLAQYIFIRLVSSITGPLRDILIIPLRASLKKRVVLTGLQQIHRLGVRFHLERQTGALTRVLDRTSEAVSNLIDMALSNVLPNIISLALTFSVILHVFSRYYVAVLLVTVALYGGISFIFTRLRMRARRERNQANSQAHHHLVDSILNIDTVRAFGNEHYELEQHNRVRQQLEMSDVRLQYLVSSSQAVRNIIIAFATALLLGMAIWDIIHHRIGVAQFVLMGTYLRSVYASVGALNYVGAGWRNAHVDMENYFDLMEREPEVKPPEKPFTLPCRGQTGIEVSFSNVSFGYVPERLILRDLTFHIPKSKNLAIVGKTGSGKSTVARLMSRAYDPLAGAVYLDECDIRELSPENLRAQIGIVPQECSLFNMTIGENIAYGRVGASEEEIKEAAHRARLGEFIKSLPDGYNTIVGERGLKLSGGEKQRIAIARIVLRDPRFLILDEATSALDTQTERAIQRELAMLSQSRTTLTIAHRLSTIQHADHIIVLDEGEIVEEGKHADLLKNNKKYAAMWFAQSSRGSL